MGKGTNQIKSVKGMPDVFSPSIEVWQSIEKEAARLFERAGFSEIRTPIVEDILLFERGIGQATDIVEKEMYTMLDRNDKRLAMRPEGTASVVRAFVEHFTTHGVIEKRFYYLGPMFRYERPQKGRFRQFFQMGAEIFGSSDPGVDAELLQLITALLKNLKISGYEIHLNSLGTVSDRQQYRKALLDFLERGKDSLCEKCVSRMGSNPLRVLDCKNPLCQEWIHRAPSILDFLSLESKKHFEEVQKYLKCAEIPFLLTPTLVRGLDYYEHTTFEFVSSKLGAQNAFLGGGRYNRLVKELGGPDVSAIGFALGMERLAHLVPLASNVKSRPKICFVPLGRQATEFLFKRLVFLREHLEATILMEFSEKSLKAKMKRADKEEATHVFILGEQEFEKGQGILRNMGTKDQHNVSLENLEKQLSTYL